MRIDRWLALILFVALPARAEPRRPALHWTRGAGASTCIDPLTLSERIEALTGPLSAARANYAIEGHIAGGESGFVVHLTVTDSAREQRGERVIERATTDCRLLDDTIVFVIALLIDPDLDLERLTRDPTLEGRSPGDALLRELEVNPPRPVVLAPVLPQAPPALPPAKEPYRWRASLAVAMASDSLRGVSLGPVVDASFPIARWLELSTQVRLLARTSEYEFDASYSLRAQSFSAAASLCLRPPSGAVSVQACLGPEPSLARARGQGFELAKSALLAVWGGLARVELAYRLDDHWSVLLQGFLRLGQRDKRFFYSSELFGTRTDVVQLARLSGGAALGVSYRFGSGNSRASDIHSRMSEVTR